MPPEALSYSLCMPPLVGRCKDVTATRQGLTLIRRISYMRLCYRAPPAPNTGPYFDTC